MRNYPVANDGCILGTSEQNCFWKRGEQVPSRYKDASGWINGWMDGWMDGWLNGWMDGWMEGCMDG